MKNIHEMSKKHFREWKYASKLCPNALETTDLSKPPLGFNQAQIKSLETLRGTLLPRLMSGEVRVAT